MINKSGPLKQLIVSSKGTFKAWISIISFLIQVSEANEEKRMKYYKTVKKKCFKNPHGKSCTEYVVYKT